MTGPIVVLRHPTRPPYCDRAASYFSAAGNVERLHQERRALDGRRLTPWGADAALRVGVELMTLVAERRAAR